MENSIVSGIMPNTLKLTQVSVDVLRQTNSFKMANTIKNNAHLKVRIRQPLSDIANILPIKLFKNDFPQQRPPKRMAANKELTIVGLSLMKSSSCSTSVNPPKTSTKIPVTNGKVGKRRSRIQLTDRDKQIATMKTPVAQKIPTRLLVIKNKTKGPISKASFSSEFGAEGLLEEFDIANI